MLNIVQLDIRILAQFSKEYNMFGIPIDLNHVTRVLETHNIILLNLCS